MALRLAEFISDTELGHVIFLSSSDVYGTEVVGQIHEQLPLNPSDAYSCSKLFGEVILREACVIQAIPILILRLTGIYGRNDLAQSTIGRLIESAGSDNRIVIFGDGEDRRDYVHIDNVSQIVEYGIKASNSGILNIATGTSHSVNQIVAMISELHSEQFRVEHRHSEEVMSQRNQSMDYDISLLVDTIPEFHPISLFEGLKMYLREY